MPSITALLPAYNERAPGAAGPCAIVSSRDRVIVDDGGLDRTAEVAALAEVMRCQENREQLSIGLELKHGK